MMDLYNQRDTIVIFLLIQIRQKQKLLSLDQIHIWPIKTYSGQFPSCHVMFNKGSFYGKGTQYLY